MKTSCTTLAVIVPALFISAGVNGQGTTSSANTGFQWFAFPDSAKFKVLGLYWFDQNKPNLWRMPAKDMDSLPKDVQGRSKCPSGGRIVMKCTTNRLAVRAVAVNGGGLRKFDAYVNGEPCKPAVAKRSSNETELVLFEDLDNQEKDIVIYLPHLQEVVVKAIGVDPQTKFNAPDRRYARPLPVVFYGSSVCQGSGAVNPGQTYEAILCRDLNLDFINLGFGGAGKAETNVVALVNSIPACCFVFDLGKSYGTQDAAAFKAMLRTVRRSHPNIPIIAVTPITSVKEVKEPSYSERSIHTRTVMRDSVNELVQAGEKQLVLVEGEELIGFNEHAALSKDGVHPSDEGYGKIAKKLSPLFKQALGL
jgi:lysophospholipase L1-like esterase